MPISVDFSGRPFHFIGIGGIGMSALAYILAKRKLPIYGSDIQRSHITQRLQDLGAEIFCHQQASNFEYVKQPQERGNKQPIGVELELSVAQNGVKTALAGVKVESLKGKGQNSPKLPQVICSTAISSGNLEYQAAQELGCPIFHRSDLLAALIQEYQSIAVAGTHGKTTTSSMIAMILLVAGLDPTILIGGEVNAWEGNARMGQGPYMVAEADESDGSLVKIKAQIGVITNIELDHPDHYESLEQVINTFKVFENNCQTLVGCIDCETVREQIQPSITYSLNPDSGADYIVKDVEYRANGILAPVWERGNFLGKLELKLLGQHNLSNALAAIAVGRQLGLEFSIIAKALADFAGAKRRFEHRGCFNDILFVDDYAHHPSEIRATLAAARLRMQDSILNTQPHLQRIVAIFQPHRYSRTHAFLQDFAQCFTDADVVILTEIYSAGEPNSWDIDGQKVADLIGHYHPQILYQPSMNDVKGCLPQLLQPGDLAIFLGAGNLNKIIPEVMAFYQTSP
ncbi:UDP-N-acetylmuramate--L-alanine ligase [Planktothrix agardhii]|jgi:UDP-N-acetylmuramate--alanine ligase|uniref:UDP-N-acetylmuramate--L-alanine ligase n=1 Tax=Planktothrix agardhii TaxID=1160 RepID=A0A1J1JFP4_PLAAG|nr:UDP-N-acetylmuramate--L-alanine ligase [Planktothrix agardhii]BBD54262.1 UDP-N-acetylmuramate--alanine ligase [Planktothrix agardhii NIES-204]MBG0745301.1 UDP-N-acetylmuramate--L-alanine ligase [Planktothrix agardhii KL2]MCF3577993.1 UDP-N-acetylmuramate--L-alanine ligase [Planktothrix agardhii 1812]MCF3579114.1 UDP-N-acetylmuramate--L-alanine ligase [Planktothrix agardhii 1811]MCF3623245.1 UDP-N-acetylmuramate--L-alanine ligase [Planktothrix agardhii 1801]